MEYREDFKKSESYKQLYVDGLEFLISQRQKEAGERRKAYSVNILSDTKKYRDDFISILGWPLIGYNDEFSPSVKKESLSDEDGYSIYRMQIEFLPGVTMTGLFYKQNSDSKRPLVIVQHGGAGTPELISGFYGDTHNYHDMLMRTVNKNVHVFAPQLLLWHEQYGAKYSREAIDAKLKMVGSSITAVEIFAIKKIIDYFEKKDYVKNFGMVGLSYGGFYTLYTSAVETRIKSAVSCAFFNSRDQYHSPDWTWYNMSEKFCDAEVACLVYPRKLYIEVADKDPLFDYSFALSSFEKIKEICKEKTDWISFSLFDGSHEFDKDEIFVEKMVEDLKV